jgi:hypothetical protein
MDKIDRVTNALRDALSAYAGLDPPDTARVVVALFGVSNSKRCARCSTNRARRRSVEG